MRKHFLKLMQLFRSGKKVKIETDESLVESQQYLLKYRLEKYMRQKEPYLKIGFSIKDMATDLNMEPYQLSAFINQEIGMHFNDYINKFRVEHCAAIMKRELPGKLNLQELAFRCGFSNRNTFTSAFKKIFGKNPSDYLRTL